MMPRPNIRARLRLLLDTGSLPSSACSREFMVFIQPLVDAGMLAVERSGAGRSLKVRDVQGVEAWFSDQFPRESGLSSAARVSAVAQFRDSKALPSNTAITVQCRCWNDAALRIQQAPAGAAEATRNHSIFTFLLEPATAYRIETPCALIENPAVFHAFENIGLTERLPLAIYAGGRMPGRVLDWLTAQQSSRFRVTHFPDYDPVGLSEYIRLHAALGRRLTLHLPPSLPRAFATFGNRKLLRNPTAQALLAKLRASNLPEVLSVVELMDKHNSGLEQEALLAS